MLEFHFITRKKFTKYSLESRLHFRVHSNLQALLEDKDHLSDNANHIVHEPICSSDEEDAFFDVSEEMVSPDRSTHNIASTSQNEREDAIRIRKETTV